MQDVVYMAALLGFSWWPLSSWWACDKIIGPDEEALAGSRTQCARSLPEPLEEQVAA